MTQLNILATGQSPDYYTINGETITAYQGGISEAYDLSTFPEGGVFQGADPVNGVPAIRNVERVNGELRVTLCQQVGPGHWTESGWMNAESYDPDKRHVYYSTAKSHGGTAWCRTRQGLVTPTGEVLTSGTMTA